MRTIMLNQGIEHSYTYTSQNWENNTQVFSTNPRFHEKTVYDVSGNTLTHPQKT